MTSAQRWTLLACILGSTVVFLDGTVVNVALPAIADGLDSRPRGADVDRRGVPADARLADPARRLARRPARAPSRLRVRRRRLRRSARCCARVAPTSETLIAARALQGVAGALLVPSTLALIVDTFPEQQRGAAIGSWTAWTGIAMVIGPLGGGLVLELVSWRWIFAVNVVPVAVTLWLLRHAPAGHARPGIPKIDWVGAALCALGLAGPVLALTEQPSRGWGDPLVAVPLIGGVVLLVAFVLWERRARMPLLPLSMFRARNFSVGNLSTFALYGGLNVLTLFLVLFLQQVSGWSPIAAGAAMLPVTLITFFLSKRFGALADTLGPRRFMGFGPLIAGAGILLLLRVGPDPSYLTDVLPAIVVFGFGLAMTVAPLTATVLGAAGVEHAGVASGVNNAVSRVAGLLAIAVAGAAVAGAASAALDDQLASARLTPAAQTAVDRARDLRLTSQAPGAPAAERAQVEQALADASVDGFHVAIWIGGGLALLGGAISLLGIKDPRREVPCESCPGGALVGASTEARPEPEPAGAA